MKFRKTSFIYKEKTFITEACFHSVTRCKTSQNILIQVSRSMLAAGVAQSMLASDMARTRWNATWLHSHWQVMCQAPRVAKGTDTWRASVTPHVIILSTHVSCGFNTCRVVIGPRVFLGRDHVCFPVYPRVVFRFVHVSLSGSSTCRFPICPRVFSGLSTSRFSVWPRARFRFAHVPVSGLTMCSFLVLPRGGFHVGHQCGLPGRAVGTSSSSSSWCWRHGCALLALLLSPVAIPVSDEGDEARRATSRNELT
jgi:hypothetical protein